MMKSKNNLNFIGYFSKTNRYKKNMDQIQMKMKLKGCFNKLEGLTQELRRREKNKL
jgi:hypothetical protein